MPTAPQVDRQLVVFSMHGEYYALLLSTCAGMFVLASAQNLVSDFLGFELLSIPLYVMCGSRIRREKSLEAGLKYLVVGSVGSAAAAAGSNTPAPIDTVPFEFLSALVS